DEILDLLTAAHELTPVDGRGSSPAEEFLVDGGPATVGVIGSATRPFCAACDRVRLTADGQVRNCLFAREAPALRGPLRSGAAAVAAGLRHVDADTVVLMAGDLPYLTAGFVELLVDAIGDSDGAVPVDDEGEPQWLCSAWRTPALRAVPWSATPSMRAALGGLRATTPGPLSDASGGAAPWGDCDTPEQLRRARELT